jgi:hypothetical protein
MRSLRPFPRLAVVLAALVVSAFAAPSALAKITVHVTNCSPYVVEVRSYDAKDGVRAVASQSKELDPGDIEWTSQELKCQGQGKGYCQIELCPPHASDAPCHTTKVKSGKYLYIVGGEHHFLSSEKKEDCPGYEPDPTAALTCVNDFVSAGKEYEIRECTSADDKKRCCPGGAESCYNCADPK